MPIDQRATAGTNGTGPVFVSVCITCRGPDADDPVRLGARLLDALAPALAERAPDVQLRPVQCLGVCKRAGTVAVTAPDGFTFVFGDLDPASAPAALAAFVDAYRAAPYGFVPWRARPEVLRRGLVARIPPAAWSPDDGAPPA